jgi:hypothetical protein
MMQALDAWLDHTPERADQLASLNPSTGIELAYEQYGTRFFELYLPDLDGAAEGAVDAAGEPLIDGLRFWNDLLTSPETPGPDADFNGDGRVDAADLASWKTGFGRSTGAMRPDGDADGDQDVDGADFLRWQTQLGASAAITSAVPEPQGLALGVVTAIATALISRRR